MFIVQASTDAVPDDMHPLAKAVYSDDAEIVRSLLEEGAGDANMEIIQGGVRAPILSAAIAIGNLETIEDLLSRDADPNAALVSPQGESPVIVVAVQHGNAAVVELLLEYGGDPNSVTTGPNGAVSVLALCVIMRNTALFEILVNRGADPSFTMTDPEGAELSLLALAIGNRDVAMARSILSLNENVEDESGDANFLYKYNFKDAEASVEYSALFCAVANNDTEMVRTLLANGANPGADLSDESGFSVSGSVRFGASPLGLAALYDNTDIVKLLSKRGARAIVDFGSGECSALAFSVVDRGVFLRFLSARGGRWKRRIRRLLNRAQLKLFFRLFPNDNDDVFEYGRGNLKIVKMLYGAHNSHKVSAPLSVTLPGGERISPLQLAALGGARNSDVFEYLLPIWGDDINVIANFTGGLGVAYDPSGEDDDVDLELEEEENDDQNDKDAGRMNMFTVLNVVVNKMRALSEGHPDLKVLDSMRNALVKRDAIMVGKNQMEETIAANILKSKKRADAKSADALHHAFDTPPASDYLEDFSRDEL